jgi:hypothetical protein
MRCKACLILLAAGAGALGLAIGHELLAKYEEPNYKVLRQSGNIEFRQYPAVIAAEVEVDGTGERAANEAFRILAGYIFGKNVARDKIAMTVPVTETITSEKIAMTVPVITASSQGKMTMRFYMPSKYSMESLPEPIDKRIKFSPVPATCYAVIRFSGLGLGPNMERHETELRNYLKERTVTPTGQAVRAFYNAPWTLPFMRRNEVWLPIEMPAT